MTDDNAFELTPELRDKMIAQAQVAQSNAYCPYSNFAVGAAIMMADGSVFTGCNVENSSYGLTICAERNAIATGVSAGHINVVAVVVVTSALSIARPCGACRQVIAEFSANDRPALILSVSADGEMIEETIETLFPNRFNLL